MDWALELAGLADTVTVVHRQDDFRALEHNVKQMKSRTKVLTPLKLIACTAMQNVYTKLPYPMWIQVRT